MYNILRTFTSSIGNRSFRNSFAPRGWVQNTVIGFGIPLTKTMYQKKSASINYIYVTEPCVINSVKPIIISSSSSNYKKDHIVGVMFSTPIEVTETGQLVDNQIYGPLSKDSLQVHAHDSNISLKYQQIKEILDENEIDLESPASEFYDLISSENLEDPIEEWIHRNKIPIRENKLKHFIGWYIQGLM